MPRPLKRGLDYFPHDVHQNDVLEYIEGTYPVKGFYLYFKLLEQIYARRGYYLNWRHRDRVLFSRKVDLPMEEIEEISSAMVHEGLFDKELFDRFNILSSEGIQERYIQATGERKNTVIIKDIWLNIDIPVSYSFDLIELSPGQTELFNRESTQSKVKESKVKESKVKETESDLVENQQLEISQTDMAALIASFPTINVTEEYEKFQKKCIDNNKIPSDALAAFKSWLKKPYAKRITRDSDVKKYLYECPSCDHRVTSIMDNLADQINCPQCQRAKLKRARPT